MTARRTEHVVGVVAESSPDGAAIGQNDQGLIIRAGCTVHRGPERLGQCVANGVGQFGHLARKAREFGEVPGVFIE
ncbi:MAG: hypothetical protein AAFN07_09240 [Pseudomonadota bacterium]